MTNQENQGMTEDENWANVEAQAGPGGPVNIVSAWVDAIRAGNIPRARALTDPAHVASFDLAALRLEFADESQWAFSTRPRALGPGVEGVLVLHESTFADGHSEGAQQTDGELPTGYLIAVVHTDDGWLVQGYVWVQDGRRADARD